MVRDAIKMVITYKYIIKASHTLQEYIDSLKQVLFYRLKPQILTVLSLLHLTRVLPSGLIAIQ